VLSDWSGRKIALLLSAVLFTLSAVGCTVAQSQNILILYRFIGGLGVGVASMLSPLYISEVSAPHLRGRLVALYQFAITIGILCAYFADAALLKLATHWQGPEDGFWYWIVHQEVWRSMFGSETVPAVLFFLLLFLVPESPRWLAAHGSKDKARAVLARVPAIAKPNAKWRKSRSLSNSKPIREPANRDLASPCSSSCSDPASAPPC
jgi:MFS family permease